MKILLVSHKFPPFIGGIETHTFEVGRRMAASGHAVTVLTGDPTGKMATEEMVDGIRVLRVPVYPKSSDIFFSPGIYKAVLKSKADIIHVQGFHTFVPPIAMLAAIRSSIPFVITFHSGGHSSALRNIVRGAQRAILRPLILRAHKLIAVSEFEAGLFARGLGVPRERIVVVPNGAEIDVRADAAPRDPNSTLIVSVGRLERYKGHQRVIDAFAELLKQRPEAELRILGEGPYKPQLLKQAQRLQLGGRVTIGGIPSEQRQRMGGILSAAAAIVLLSDYEAHPVAALEGIAVGRPVLANNSTGFAEMVRKGLLRGLDPNASPSQVAAAIIEEIDRPQASRPKVKISNWDDCAQDLLDVYRNIVNQKTLGTIKTTKSLTTSPDPKPTNSGAKA
jgi:glycosyltransferase involved in cell wall biosynthesis